MPIAPFVRAWAPMRIDALGIVTMIGAEQVNVWIGRLTSSYITDLLPLLGAFVIAGNAFTEPIPGFVLYNITDGIMATDVSGWFARWLLCQNIPFAKTTISISSTQWPRSGAWYVITYSLGALSTVPAFVLAVLGHDWWGLGNAVATAVSIIVRKSVVEMNKRALDTATEEAEEMDHEEVKVFLTMPTGQGVVIRTSRAIVLNCLLTKPRPSNRSLYDLIRAIGWLAFGCHVIALGMSSFVIQLITVVTMVPATVLATRGAGSDNTRIGRRLLSIRSDFAGTSSRGRMFASLEMTKTEEDSMVHWNMCPQRSNTRWWSAYQEQLASQDKTFENWKEKLKRPGTIVSQCTDNLVQSETEI